MSLPQLGYEILFSYGTNLLVPVFNWQRWFQCFPLCCWPYLFSFDNHGLYSGISHFLHHRWPGGAKSAQTYQPPEPMISIFGYFPARYSSNLPWVSYWHNFVIPPYIGSSSFPQWTLRESSITVWCSPHEIDNSAFMTVSKLSHIFKPPFCCFLVFTFSHPPSSIL